MCHTVCGYSFKSHFVKGSGKKIRRRFYGQVFVIFVKKVVIFGLILPFYKGKNWIKNAYGQAFEFLTPSKIDERKISEH